MLRRAAMVVRMALVQGSVVAADPFAKPDVLIKAEEARRAIRTARIEWSVRCPAATGDARERTYFHTWRCAGDRFLNERRGDDEGVYSRGDGGRPLDAQHQNPEGFLMMDGVMWHSEQRSPLARVWNAQQRSTFDLFDLRRLGFRVTRASDEDMDAVLRAAGAPPIEYGSPERDGGLIHLSGHMSEADFHWWIDDSRDWNIVRASMVHRDGRTAGEVEFDLALFDGRWFPARARQYRGDKAGGDLFEDLRIIAAEFNRPEHPQVLTPESIGIEPGTPLQYMLLDPPTAAPVWDGSAVVSITEFYDRVRAGEAALGPTLLRERARVVARSERLARVEAASAGVIERVTWRDIDAAWERYTRQFVERYRLEAKQSEQAWRVCEDCQRQAREFIDRNREKLEARDRAGGSPAIAAAAASGDATATDGAAPGDATAADGGASGNASAADRAASDAATHAAPKRRDELLGRIDEIFDKRLKARLETIPTGAQREAAAKLPPIPEPRLLSVNAENAARADQGARTPR
ncbi:MAG: hypothetical protein AB7Q17_03090 [Phycisphaerae bacterium]